MGKVYSVTPKLVLILVLFALFRILYKVVIEFFVNGLMIRLGQEARFHNVEKLIRFIWWCTYSVLVISIFVGNVTALLASFGLVGFGLTLALQKPILNFVGWLVIIIKDVYREGDRIKVGKTKGDVREIGLMNTVVDGLLEDADVKSNKSIIFPNELVLTSEVQNYTRDSNYILEELSITITYESDFEKAMKILEKIITNYIIKHKKEYMKQVQAKKIELNTLVRRLSRLKESKQKEDEEIRIKKEKVRLERETKELDELGDEFKPNIRVELLDSAIQLIGMYLTPYKKVKETRTAINLAFLNAVKKEKNIEIAYPHMQIVYNQK